jgi:hypothetical protein
MNGEVKEWMPWKGNMPRVVVVSMIVDMHQPLRVRCIRTNTKTTLVSSSLGVNLLHLACIPVIVWPGFDPQCPTSRDE